MAQKLTIKQKEILNQVISEIQEYKKTYTDPYETVMWFIGKVGTGKAWDFKNRKEITGSDPQGDYEYFGNYCYGYAGKVLGLDDGFLLSGASGAQACSNNKKLLDALYIPIKVCTAATTLASQVVGGYKSIDSLFNYVKYDEVLAKFGEWDNKDDIEKIIDGINAAKQDGYLEDTINIFTGLFGISYHYTHSFLKDAIVDLENYFNPTVKVTTYDPLVLDLNNNGRIDTITLNNSKAFFDHNNDNIAYKSSWISKDDGLLVLDKNNNNLIDNGNELFGNFTEIPSSDFKTLDTNNNQTLNHTQAKFAINGFEALKLLDSNEDGVIDINDKEFNNLKIWQDLNEDGITQINELKALKDLNITSINLNYKDTNQKLDNDNTITQTKESLTKLKPTQLKSA